MSNFCTECGAALVGPKKFCAECGTAVSVASDPTLAAQEAHPPATPFVAREDLGEELDSDSGDDGDDSDDDAPFSPMATALLAHAMANGGDTTDFWVNSLAFSNWQLEPRGPSLKTEWPSDFVFTGRDHRQAAAFEQLLIRNGITMGPAGLDAADDRSQWDYYTGFWHINSDETFPIDVYFGRRSSTGADALFVRSPLLLVPMVGGRGGQQVNLPELATTMWDDVFNLAENPPPGNVLAPFGEFGPGYFGHFDRKDHPIRGLLASETNLVRFLRRGRSGVAQTSSIWRSIEVWYLVDAPPPAADGIFTQVADVITEAQTLLRAAAYDSDDGIVCGGIVYAALSADAEALLRSGFLANIEWV